MKRAHAYALLLAVAMTAPNAVAGEDVPATVGDEVVHTSVERLDAAPRPLDELGEITEENRERIARRQDRLMRGLQHPEEGPPFETLDVAPEMLVPRNRPTGVGPVADGANAVELYVNTTASSRRR